MQESEILEFKTSTAELKEAIISVVAILNKHQKGELYFGMKNDGTIIGQDISDKTLRDVSQTISDHIEPKIYPKVNKVVLEDKSCIHVIFEGHNVPYFAYGRAYIRVGAENKQLSTYELKNLILSSNDEYWERQLSDKAIGSVNVQVLKEYMEKANEAKRINFEFVDVRSTLNKLGMLKENNLIRAAEILFCNDNSLDVQAAVFAGTDKITFLDIQQFKGTLFELLVKSEGYIKEHMNWRANLTERGREEIPEVPIRALVETLVNSLCHRDYTNPKGNEIAIFKDRIEVYNPGNFPNDYEPQDFIKGEERSILRNPLIAQALFLSKDIERWGSGIKRIYEACKQEKVKVEFKKLKSGFCVVFYRKQISPQISPQKLTELESNILKIIHKNNAVSRKEIARELRISEDTVKEYLERLKIKSFIRRVGPDRGGYWEVIDKNKKNENDR